MKQMSIENWICYAVGYVFITSAVLKLMVADFKAVFIQLDLPFPLATLFLVAITEIVCGTLIASKMYAKQAALPLIVIIIAAIYLTKMPLLFSQGVLSFAFEARLDIVMLILLLLIWRNSPVK